MKGVAGVPLPDMSENIVAHDFAQRTVGKFA